MYRYIQSSDIDPEVRKQYSKYIDDRSHDDQLDSDEKVWVEELRKENASIKPWSAAERKRSKELTQFLHSKLYCTDEWQEFYKEQVVIPDIETAEIAKPNQKPERITISKCRLLYVQNWDENDNRVRKGSGVPDSTFYIVETEDGPVDEDCWAYKTLGDARHAMNLYIAEHR